MSCFLSVTSEGPGGRRGTKLPDCLFTFALFKWCLSSQHLLHITTQISVLMTAIMPAYTHTHSHACLLQHTHSMPVTWPLSNVHLGHFTLSKPPCTTNGPSLAAGPFLFAPSLLLFPPVWCSLMDANGHLLNWISSQDRDKRGTAFFFFTLRLFQVILSCAQFSSVWRGH